MLLKGLFVAFIAEARALGFAAALPHFFGSLRSLRFPGRTKRVSDVLRRSEADRWLPGHEHYFHIRHRFYLSKRLSTEQRIDSVTHHYLHEARCFVPDYRRRVYGGSGLVLWESRIDGNDFSIRLSSSAEMRWEGDLSVELFVNDVALQVMSFAYVDASLFGLPSAPILFITRTQRHRVDDGHELFRAAFRHTLPPYFCLAAVIGIATANGMRRVAAVRHDAQIACTDAIAETLKNSYDEFWRAFQATELEAGVFLLPVPMATVPLAEVKAKHRQRASNRRDAWGEVTTSAIARLGGLRVTAPRAMRASAAHCLGSAYVLLTPLIGA